MIQKKICMLGYHGVGKTSLVARFVQSIFSDKYHSTIGVKVDKKLMEIGDQTINLMLWDIHGEDEFQTVQMSYLRGASGYILVVDGTRYNTLEAALRLQTRAQGACGAIPFIIVFNKADLAEEWEIDDQVIEGLIRKGWIVLRASARTGEGVEDAFQILGTAMLHAMNGGV